MPAMAEPVRPPCSLEQVAAMLEPAALAAALRGAQTRHGHSLRAAARAMQLTPFTVDRVLEGRQDPSLATVRIMLHYIQAAQGLPTPAVVFLSRAKAGAECTEHRYGERGDCWGALGLYEITGPAGQIGGGRDAVIGSSRVFCRSHADQINGRPGR